jgi:hypothetical protein
MHYEGPGMTTDALASGVPRESPPVSPPGHGGLEMGWSHTTSIYCACGRSGARAMISSRYCITSPVV